MTSLNYMQSGHKSTVPMCFHSPFIEYGYRSTNYFSEAFFSVFSFHNEIMNIWSHLIGFICVLVAGYQISLEFFSDYDKFYEIIALETYILCASICLLLSSIYHWFGCLSEGHHENLLKMDLTGVALLTAGSYFAAVYYGFYCTPTDQTVHLGLTCLVLVVGLIAPWVEFKVNGTNIRPFIFMSLVILGLVPFIHWMVITPTVFRDELVQGFLWIFFWYGVGFTMYMSRLPERLFPNS